MGKERTKERVVREAKRAKETSKSGTAFALENILIEQIKDPYDFYRQRLQDYPKEVLDSYIRTLADFFMSDLEEGVHKETTEVLSVPPIVVAKAGEEYILIDGTLRLEAVKRASKNSIRAIVLSPDENVDFDIFVLEERARRNAGQGLALLENSQREIARLLYEAGRSIREIARILGVSVRSVYRYTSDLRVEKRTKLSEDAVKEIVERVANGESIRKVAKDYAVSHVAILKAIKKMQPEGKKGTLSEYLKEGWGIDIHKNNAYEISEEEAKTIRSVVNGGKSDLNDNSGGDHNIEEAFWSEEVEEEGKATANRLCLPLDLLEGMRKALETSEAVLIKRLKEAVEEGNENEVYEIAKAFERIAKKIRKEVLKHERKLSDKERATLEFVERYVTNVANKYATAKKYAGLIESHAEKLLPNAFEKERFYILLGLLMKYWDKKIESADDFTFEAIEEFWEKVADQALVDPDAEGAVYAKRIRLKRNLDTIPEGWIKGDVIAYDPMEVPAEAVKKAYRSLRRIPPTLLLEAVRKGLKMSELMKGVANTRFKTVIAKYLARTIVNQIKKAKDFFTIRRAFRKLPTNERAKWKDLYVALFPTVKTSADAYALALDKLYDEFVAFTKAYNIDVKNLYLASEVPSLLAQLYFLVTRASFLSNLLP